MSYAQDGTTSKCFSGILRRLLCTGSLPTHPTDVITEPLKKAANFDHPRKDMKFQANKAQQAPATPGIVARLMGLDTLPDSNWTPEERSLNSILRSRSVNSVNYLPELDQTEAWHRRVRTSVSFREVPSSLKHQQQQNHGLFVLCFEKVGGSSKLILRTLGKCETGSEELDQREAERVMKKENSKLRNKFGNTEKENQENKNMMLNRKEDGGKRSSKVNDSSVNLPIKKKTVHGKPSETPKAKNVVRPINGKKKSTESNFRNKKKGRSEDSSPVSVLGPQSTLTHHEITSPEESRAKSSAKLVDNDDDSRSNSAPAFIADEHAVRAKRNREDKAAKKSETLYYVELQNLICRLTEEDTGEGSNWVAQTHHERVINFENVDEICTEFGQQILDYVIEEELLVACNNMHEPEQQ